MDGNTGKIIVILGILVIILLVVFTFFGNIFASPEEICALQGALYDPVRDICVPAGGINQSCAPIISNGTCQLGLSCQFDLLAPQNGFFTCKGELQFPVNGGFFQ